MPELPEVEMYRRYFNETSLNQVIRKVDILHPKVVGGQDELLMQLSGDKFVHTDRWGKTLLVQPAEGNTLFMHFGMTGHLEYYSSTIDIPKYTRVVINFESGFNLAYVSKRMFGRVGVTASLSDYVDQKSLGEDALLISEATFIGAISGKNKNIKAALLDQSVTAGVGNWIADEILYQTKIYPTTRTHDLSEKQLTSIFKSMQDVMNTAIKVDAVREDLPESYITRYGRKSSIACPDCGTTIERVEIGGRGTFACSQCQKEF